MAASKISGWRHRRRKRRNQRKTRNLGVSKKTGRRRSGVGVAAIVAGVMAWRLASDEKSEKRNHGARQQWRQYQYESIVTAGGNRMVSGGFLSSAKTVMAYQRNKTCDISGRK
jgi:hypothetical protein